jgi:hypothetical protein
MTTDQLSTATNLGGPNIANSTDPRKYFNNLYAIPFSVSANVNDAVTAFFEEYTGNKAEGDNLAATVIYTALAQNLNPIDVLAQFKKLSNNQLNSYLTAFLNANRVKTSQLGFKTSTSTNQFVKRSILV